MSEQGAHHGTTSALGETATHAIWSRDGAVFAIPKGLEDIDPAVVDLTEPPDGIIVAASQEELQTRLDLGSAWANSRGLFDEREFQRQAGTYLRAASTLGDDVIEAAPTRQVVVKIDGMFYAIDIDEFADSWLSNATASAPDTDSPRLSHLQSRIVVNDGRDLDAVKFLFVRSEDAVPELLRTIRNYNLVRYDWVYYGVPQGIPIDWASPHLRLVPGLIWGDDLRDVTRRIYDTTGYVAMGRQAADDARGLGAAEETSDVPRLVGSIEGYNIVSYEGWFHGIPQGIGHMDLTETDVLDPAIIRDVSRDVVENEILDLVRRTREPNTAPPVPQAEPAPAATERPPRLPPPTLIGSIRSYNIVHYDGFYLGVPRSLGPLDLTTVPESNPEIIRARSRDAVEATVIARAKEEKAGRAAAAPVAEAPKPVTIEPPRLVGSVDAYNIVLYDKQYYGVPQSLGPTDISTVSELHPNIIVGTTRGAVDEQITQHAS